MSRVNEYKVVIFGAGASGRGHLSELLVKDGIHDIVFVDNNRYLIEKLNEKSQYTVNLYSINTGKRSWRNISRFKAISRYDIENIVKEFSDCNLVLTSVLAENLSDIADILVSCISNRKKAGNYNFLNIVCCENYHHASGMLKQYLQSRISIEESEYLDKYIGFPNAMISRVVPQGSLDTLDIITEDYNEWVIDKKEFKGDLPSLPSIDFAYNLDARLERKLWIHNGGHAALAYAANLKGYKYIHESIRDMELVDFVSRVLDEIGDCIIHKYNGDFTEPEIRQYQSDLADRGSLEVICDEVERVIRSPIRKLQMKDRLLAPAIYAENNGLKNESIIQAIINAVKYNCPDDQESKIMQGVIANRGFEKFIEEYIGLERSNPIYEKLIKKWNEEMR